MLRIIKDNLLVSFLVGFLMGAISFVILINTSYHYKATAKVLVVQDQLGTQDFYSLTKSAEYLGDVLVEATHSTTFIKAIKETEYVDVSFFPKTAKEQLKKWKKMVRVERTSNPGILKIIVTDNNRDETYKIADGVLQVLRYKNYLFRGKTNVDVRVLSDVVVEKNPDIKTIVIILFGNFLLGFLISNIIFYYKDINYSSKLIDGTMLNLG